MSSPTQATRALSLLLAAALSTSAQAFAEDSESTPSAPPSVPTAEPSASTMDGSAVSSGQPLTTSSTLEPTFRSETRGKSWPNVPLLATGSVVLAGAYIPAAVVAGVRDTRDDNDLYIPIAGPWMMLTSGRTETTGDKTLLVVDGVAQGIGALMLLSSFLIPERVTSRWYLIGSKDDIRLSPTRVATGYGVGASGRF